ncbi:hypothetical protein, partial [Nitratidesulfovibrio oxamicus]|uniref:hypothetical protein n=1 Tax=Nitratidesulfovibrio oxamicus TaxID=32016 RepID=UPI001E60950A
RRIRQAGLMGRMRRTRPVTPRGVVARHVRRFPAARMILRRLSVVVLLHVVVPVRGGLRHAPV